MAAKEVIHFRFRVQLDVGPSFLVRFCSTPPAPIFALPLPRENQFCGPTYGSPLTCASRGLRQ